MCWSCFGCVQLFGIELSGYAVRFDEVGALVVGVAGCHVVFDVAQLDVGVGCEPFDRLVEVEVLDGLHEVDDVAVGLVVEVVVEFVRR